MKLTRLEKIWLVAVIIFYVLYNLPFFPKYGHANATILHGILTLAPLWSTVYVGLWKVCKRFPLKAVDNNDLQSCENPICSDANSQATEPEDLTPNKEEP